MAHVTQNAKKMILVLQLEFFPLINPPSVISNGNLFFTCFLLNIASLQDIGCYDT